MTARVFADTNVLVYQLDARAPERQTRARAWMEHLWTARNGRISVQVLQELYVTLTRKLDPGLEPQAAREMVRALFAWKPIPVDEQLFAGAWAVQDRFGLSWWDSLIVAAAKAADCSLLLTEDLQHGQILGGLRVVDPFRVSPEGAEAE